MRINIPGLLLNSAVGTNTSMIWCVVHSRLHCSIRPVRVPARERNCALLLWSTAVQRTEGAAKYRRPHREGFQGLWRMHAHVGKGLCQGPYLLEALVIGANTGMRSGHHLNTRVQLVRTLTVGLRGGIPTKCNLKGEQLLHSSPSETSNSCE